MESCGSPLDVARVGIAPNTFTTRRTRTISATAKIDEAELEDGTGSSQSFKTIRPAVKYKFYVKKPSL